MQCLQYIFVHHARIHMYTICINNHYVLLELGRETGLVGCLGCENDGIHLCELTTVRSGQ